ncbi:MAG: dihydrodipicolinate reductase [Planctomycetota bacterium]
MSKGPWRVVQFGLGPIGLACARAILEHPRLELVGAIDHDPGLEGRALGAFLPMDAPHCDVVVVGDLDEALEEGVSADVAIHTTQSRISQVRSQLEVICQAGLNVVSSCEELLWPKTAAAEEAEALDAFAKEHGVSIIGSGVNPGFVLDTLALVASAPSAQVQKIIARRVVDAGSRRGPLQRKVGAGKTEEEFRALAAEKKLGHVGLVESLDLVAAGLGWELKRREEKLEPVMAEAAIETEHVTVAAGRVAGIHHTAVGETADGRLIDIDLKMYVGAQDPHDEVHIEGTPKVHLEALGGIAGDSATTSMLINLIPRIVEAAPGLRTMLDIGLPRSF